MNQDSPSLIHNQFWCCHSTLHHRKRLSFSPNFAKLLIFSSSRQKCPFSNLAFLCNLVKTILFWALFLSLLFEVILGLDLRLPLSVRCSPLLVSAGPKNEIKHQNITQLIHTLHWSEMFFLNLGDNNKIIYCLLVQSNVCHLTSSSFDLCSNFCISTLCFLSAPLDLSDTNKKHEL